ncbi:hypothetical protein OG728_37580 [Streptomyces microflavus]|uniref:hypothetical protein n=1 Tax=Streptomyces microflavus TaxID=1919 RepID=UPI002E10ECB6|nr:hypothetical protein OG728_37580 [Streptomyces microflavus]
MRTIKAVALPQPGDLDGLGGGGAKGELDVVAHDGAEAAEDVGGAGSAAGTDDHGAARGPDGLGGGADRPEVLLGGEGGDVCRVLAQQVGVGAGGECADLPSSSTAIHWQTSPS